LNPERKYYSRLKLILDEDYEDNYWLEDAIFMERNSRDFVSRIHRINKNAEAICQTLKASPIGKGLFWQYWDLLIVAQSKKYTIRSIAQHVNFMISAVLRKGAMEAYFRLLFTQA